MASSFTELRLSTSFPTEASILYLVSCSTYLKSLSHHRKGCCVKEEAVYDIRGYLCGSEGEWWHSGQLLVALGLPDALLPGTTGDTADLLLLLYSWCYIWLGCAWKSVVQNKSLPGKCKRKWIYKIQNSNSMRGDTNVNIYHIRLSFVFRGLLIALLNTWREALSLHDINCTAEQSIPSGLNL